MSNIQPVQFFFNFSQPLTPSPPNHRDLIKQFVLNLMGTNLISNTAQFYDSGALFTISLNRSIPQFLAPPLITNTTHEIIGFDAYARKMAELNASAVNYTSGTVVLQPLGSERAIVTIVGECQINGSTYKYHLTLILNISNYKIDHMIHYICW